MKLKAVLPSEGANHAPNYGTNCAPNLQPGFSSGSRNHRIISADKRCCIESSGSGPVAVEPSCLWSISVSIVICSNLAEPIVAQSVVIRPVAGRSRTQKSAKESCANVPAPAPKVITNSDLPRDPDGYTTATANPHASPSPANAAASRKAAAQSAAQQRAAAQWRQQILSQENKVANLQGRVDRLRAQIHLVNPNANYSSSEGIAYNPGQARQLVRLQEMQDQLNQQRQRLEQMQEGARHAGMHTTVYDP